MKMDNQRKQIRNFNHVLESVSERKLAVILPEKWTIDKPQPDYGIDQVIEIFSENGSWTGKRFYVQLKATANKDLTKAKNYDFEIDKLKYYNQLDLPMLIVRFCKSNNKFYGKWSHLIELKENQQNQRLHFEESDLMNKEFIKKIELFIDYYRISKNKKLKSPYDINLNFFENNIKFDKFEFKQLLREKTNELSIFGNFKKSEFAINVDISSDCIYIDFINHYKKSIKRKDSLNDMVTDVIINIILILIEYKKTIDLYDMLAKIALKDLMNYEESIRNEIIDAFFNTDYIGTIFLLNWLIDLDKDKFEKIVLNVSLILNIFAINIISDKKNIKIISSKIINRLEKIDEEKAKEMMGIALYNKANQYLNSGSWRYAVNLYLKAAKLKPDYKEKEYFWQELGCGFFEIKKYRCSYNCYSKAFLFGEKEDLKVFMGDALLYLNEFEESIKLFKEYFSNFKEINIQDYYWYYKLELVKNIIDILKNTNNSYINNIEIKNKYQDLIIDFTNSNYWFNLGIAFNEIKCNARSFEAFRNCLILNLDDSEALANLICILINDNSKDLVADFFNIIQLLKIKNYQETIENASKICCETFDDINIKNKFFDLMENMLQI